MQAQERRWETAGKRGRDRKKRYGRRRGGASGEGRDKLFLTVRYVPECGGFYG